MLDDFTLKVSPLAGFLVVVSLFLSGYFGLRGDPMVRPFLLTHAYMPNDTRLQLDAIPTVGFSDPILSYLSAVRFFVDGVRMLNEGYQKVICLSLDSPSSYQADDASTFRQDQVYSKSPIFKDGWCWLPDLN